MSDCVTNVSFSAVSSFQTYLSSFRHLRFCRTPNHWSLSVPSSLSYILKATITYTLYAGLYITHCILLPNLSTLLCFFNSSLLAMIRFMSSHLWFFEMEIGKMRWGRGKLFSFQNSAVLLDRRRIWFNDNVRNPSLKWNPMSAISI